MLSDSPFLDESAPSILADGLLCASDFLQVGTGKLLAKRKGLLPFLRQSIYFGGTLARTPGTNAVAKAPEASGDFRMFTDAARDPPDPYFTQLKQTRGVCLT